ncbi:Catabolic 3-dehydroquinase 1 [Fusarium torreyae]|uniref:Catabolic 3-dehydroquinase n=1 Tax=Fusarium torreyae TaxID=1237075 RepID=A0A9W8RUW0_9HYPO|nr:Catabolic 3-dehydroquinase 1 [Fusarium torreyae]
MPKSILLINGPNLNLLGTREPHIYGHTKLKDLEANSQKYAESLGAQFQVFQANSEGDIVDRIHAARGNIDVIVINPAAYTHTSVAIRDALTGVNIPFIELHISNTHSREAFRHKSYLSDKAVAVIMGFGIHGYRYAIDHAVNNM